MSQEESPDLLPPNLRPANGFSLSLGAWIVAALGAALIAVVWLTFITAVTLGIWHWTILIKGLMLGGRTGLQNAETFAIMLSEAWMGVLIIRQLLTRKPPAKAWLEFLPSDQPRLYKLVEQLCTALGTPIPKQIVGDSTAQLQLEHPAWLGRATHLRIGLSLVSGLQRPEFAACLTHELAYAGAARGAWAFRLICNVDRWFRLRASEDPWRNWFKSKLGDCSTLMLFPHALGWLSVFVASLPIEVAHRIFHVLVRPVYIAHQKASDECAAKLVSGPVYARALENRSLLVGLRAAVAAELKDMDEKSGNRNVADSIPLLIARRHAATANRQIDPHARHHWLPASHTDLQRLKAVRGSVANPSWRLAEDHASAVFRSFHEHGRKISLFHYQNDLGWEIGHLRRINTEEFLHHRRDSAQLIAELNRFYRGAIHPERALCGLAAEGQSQKSKEQLIKELNECRVWIAKYNTRMASSLSEWSAAWRLVRDLEVAGVMLKAGLPIEKRQFAVTTIAEVAEESERQRTVMENLEAGIKEFESRMETRMACNLELIMREDDETLGADFLKLKDTLPNWALVYEALGLQLPAIRELITTYHAFMALGSSISGTEDSASYVTTVQTLIPRVNQLMLAIARELSTWPYPFKPEHGDQALTLAGCLGSGPEEISKLHTSAQTGVDPRLWALSVSRQLVEVVAPFIDRYLNLYHQSFAWLSRAAQAAEAMYCDPLPIYSSEEADTEAAPELAMVA